MSFNYFGATVAHAANYAKVRPRPPETLIQEILSFLKSQSANANLAVDVGCGSGQSTIILAPYFKQVIGLDPSHEIIREANKLKTVPNVDFRVSEAESLPFDNQTVDLVTTVQAVHWFKFSQFYSEVERVLKTNGVIAIYGYNLPEIAGSEDGSKLIRKYYSEVLKDFVLDGSRKVYLNKYTDPEFNQVPFVKDGLMIRKGNFVTEISTSVSDLVGYLSTWSGFQNFVKQRGQSEAQAILDECQKELCAVLQKTPADGVVVSYEKTRLLGVILTTSPSPCTAGLKNMLLMLTKMAGSTFPETLKRNLDQPSHVDNKNLLISNYSGKQYKRPMMLYLK